jgi:hypothetical protein
MADEHIERRTFIGETGTMAFDDYAGFRMGQSYQLRYTQEFDDVRIQLDHAPQPGQVLTLPLKDFNKWFVKG